MLPCTLNLPWYRLVVTVTIGRIFLPNWFCRQVVHRPVYTRVILRWIGQHTFIYLMSHDNNSSRSSSSDGSRCFDRPISRLSSLACAFRRSLASAFARGRGTPVEMNYPSTHRVTWLEQAASESRFQTQFVHDDDAVSVTTMGLTVS